MASAAPAAIKLQLDANLLEVTWQDGHVSRYAGSYLRKICPCAACVGHAPGEREPPSWKQVEGVRVTHVAAVGSYALKLTLSDAHASGIYSYDFLRRSCPSERPDVDDTGLPTLEL
ncbi:MAG: DUF971 domain-containing protein [Planctomycetota bacterium]|nr:DUF971 domain-containing protein [Planctomycetota bacterium]